MHQKGSQITLLVGLVVILAAGVITWSYLKETSSPRLSNNQGTEPTSKANSLEPSPQTSPAQQTQQDDTRNWQTYRNEKYGFEVKYPPGFIVDENTTACRTESKNASPFVLIRNKDDWSSQQGGLTATGGIGDFDIYINDLNAQCVKTYDNPGPGGPEAASRAENNELMSTETVKISGFSPVYARSVLSLVL